MKAAVTFRIFGHLIKAIIVSKFPDNPKIKYPVRTTATATSKPR